MFKCQDTIISAEQLIFMYTHVNWGLSIIHVFDATTIKGMFCIKNVGCMGNYIIMLLL